MADDMNIIEQAEADARAMRDEIERLRLIVDAYATAADGIVLNWSKDRFGNWVAFDVAHRALLDEARRG